MKKVRFFCCGLFILVALITLIGWFWHLLVTSDELGSKPEWSNLQELFSSGQKLVLKESIIVDNMSYKKRFLVLGVPEKNGKFNIWILLNPSYKSYYKQLPEGDYQIDAPTLIKVLSTGEAHPYVAKQLVSHMELKEGEE